MILSENTNSHTGFGCVDLGVTSGHPVERVDFMLGKLFTGRGRGGFAGLGFILGYYPHQGGLGSPKIIKMLGGWRKSAQFARKTREKRTKNAKNRLLALVCAPKNLDLVLIGRKVARFTHTYSLYSSLIKCFNKSD